jgi:hypothetical protein
MRKRWLAARRPDQVTIQSESALNIAQEAEYIMGRAEEGDARLVTLGPLLFFSTALRDAWVLDPADGLALCLMADGERQPNRILETETQFAIDWPATYTIEGDIFMVAEKDRVRTYHGYLVDEVARAARRCR